MIVFFFYDKKNYDKAASVSDCITRPAAWLSMDQSNMTAHLQWSNVRYWSRLRGQYNITDENIFHNSGYYPERTDTNSTAYHRQSGLSGSGRATFQTQSLCAAVLPEFQSAQHFNLTVSSSRYALIWVFRSSILQIACASFVTFDQGGQVIAAKGPAPLWT